MNDLFFVKRPCFDCSSSLAKSLGYSVQQLPPLFWDHCNDNQVVKTMLTKTMIKKITIADVTIAVRFSSMNIFIFSNTSTCCSTSSKLRSSESWPEQSGSWELLKCSTIEFYIKNIIKSIKYSQGYIYIYIWTVFCSKLK